MWDLRFGGRIFWAVGTDLGGKDCRISLGHERLEEDGGIIGPVREVLAGPDVPQKHKRGLRERGGQV